MEFALFAEREREGWADPAISGAYVDKFGPVVDRVAETVLARADASPGSAVLDLCCGQGTLTAELAATGASVTGVDFSPTMLARAAEAVPSATLVEADAQSLPFEAESFDRVVCNFGLLHMPDRPAALAEVARVLRPGGLFVYTNWCPPPENPAFATIFGAIKANIDPETPPPPAPDLFELADPARAEPMLEAAGLSPQSREVVRHHWQTAEADGLFDIFRDATVGARLAILSQSEARIAAMRKAVADKVAAEFAGDGCFRIPVTAAVVVAVTS
ncbi:MAG: class I SAM-dependent methyltransferase [Paracoccaceae bacterium]